MFKFLLTTSSTAVIGLSLMALAWLDQATYFVA